MTNTPNLALPYLAAAQAQKHVTVNEALSLIDAMAQMAVVAVGATSPPATPTEGDRHIIGAGATGAWSGWDNSIALFSGGAWLRLIPQTGWMAWDVSASELLVWNGSAWASFVPNLQNLAGVGIGTTSDATNKLAVSAAATLLNHAGNGHQLKINKAASGDTSSLLFQTNWSGRAEMGTTGSDDFVVKVSPDGSTWHNGITVDRSNGYLSLLGVSGSIPVFNTGQSIFIGELAGANDDLTVNRNVFIGYASGNSNTSGSSNCAIGYNSLKSNTSGIRNMAIGGSALFSTTTGQQNCCIGVGALYSNIDGNNNSAIGLNALRYTTAGSANTSFSNCTGIGLDTRVSGANQVQLGNGSTTVYAFGAVQNRSDARDKTDVRDTALGLDFINALRAVDFRWDMRDDYFDNIKKTDPKTGEVTEILAPVKKDGSRSRNRYHHGLIAQEVEAVLKEMGIDFGGLQDHARSGGNDVKSIGYTELIAPLIKAVQELTARVTALENP